ncbi:MAG TPA: glycoside hydrolase family 57 protein, partial [Thermodesulfobacteriota bacterium]|nr:glycoside hydrolase family 57 protein [Thermodesulfobacteriota bacterium]
GRRAPLRGAAGRGGLAGPMTARDRPPLHVAVLWHMHQPDYRDRATGQSRLPWVRLHALKDYYDMAALLEHFPAVRQTFNLVPVLLEQLEAAARGEYPDRALLLFERPAAALTAEERTELVETFFQANPRTMIEPLPRYRELFERRSRARTAAELATGPEALSEQELRDLQVLFHLAWTDPLLRETDDLLRALVAKGRDYTEEDKRRLKERMRAVLAAIVPLYRRLADRGQIELTTSPYYHPILPLLCDTAAAREALPDIRLPAVRFAHPEDAAAQLARAVAFMRERFGRPPAGLWPSEGAVSEAILPLVAQAGFRWLATDEGILARSLGLAFGAGREGEEARLAALYRPYRLRRPGGVDLAIVFRDQVLSDLIGFVYARWDPVAAADDLVARLTALRTALAARGGEGPHLVTIALDGENAWEHYPDDGREFLARLYTRLSEEPGLRSVTVGEHLAAHPPERELPRLFAGSWINHNFRIWIGHEEDNAAWEALAAARQALVAAAEAPVAPLERLAEAWEALYAAEGSDWTWWYGDDHHSAQAPVFDALFRAHLSRVYTLIGRPVPADLTVPIKGRFRQEAAEAGPRAFIAPVIDGRISGYYEWYGAACFEPGRRGGAMHAARGVVAALRYGFDPERLYVRIDPGATLDSLVGEAGRSPASAALGFALVVTDPRPMAVEIRCRGRGEATAWLQRADGTTQPLPAVAADDVVELAVPFAELGLRPEEPVRFRLVVRRGEAVVEEWPDTGTFRFDVPTEDFEARMWTA